MRNAEFNDPRLVVVYDALFPWSRDDDYFMSVVSAAVINAAVINAAEAGESGTDRARAARVLDLGCGTGRLTLALAAAGHVVTGIDPARASLDAARAKPGADLVTWIEGTSAALPAASFDVAVMTSHVAQFFVTDQEWLTVLADLRRALVPGGTLAFDTRDPDARGWERWNPADWRRTAALPDGRTVTAAISVDEVSGGVVTTTIRYAFSDGPDLASVASLRFRSEAEVRASLAQSGFAVRAIYGGWNKEPVGAPDGELLVVAAA